MNISLNRQTKKDVYNKTYFEKRDLLDLHLAKTITILMEENGLEKVLDAGCGTGRLVKFLNESGFDAIGCDNYEEAVKVAQTLNGKRVIKSSATRLPFKKNSFDMLTAISLIEHLTKKEADAFINEAKRVLKPYGLIFLVTPNFATPIRYLQRKRWFGYSDPTHINFYSPKTLSKLLKKCGFSNTRLSFKTMYDPPYEWELPGVLGKLPKSAKIILTYLLISSPLSWIRNSFWMAAQKNE